MKSHRHLGISFCNGSIQLAEIEQGRNASVTVLAEGKTSIDFVEAGIHLSADHPQVATLVTELGDLLKRNKVTAKMISYAIPADPAFINIIPLSASLRGQALTQYLQWEVKQYFPDAGPKDFIVDSHPLPSKDPAAKPGFVVGVRRGMVGFLQKVTAELKMQLHIIDIDHLSTEKTISFNYPEISGHPVALYCVRMTGMIASIVRNGEIVDYRAYKVQVPSEIVKTVLSYLKYVKQAETPLTPDAVFLYGSNLSPDLVKQVRAEADIQTLLVNSLRKLPVSGKVFQPFTKESNRFAPAIGLGLRAS